MSNPLLMFFKRRFRAGHDIGEGPYSIRSLFHKFRRILELNNSILEKMAELESAMGGEYIFDISFLSRSVRELSGLVHQAVYSLNAMTDNRYMELYDRFEHLKSVLYDILAGGLGPHSRQLTMSFSKIHWEDQPLTGMANVCLAELLRMPEIGAVDGFTVTATGSTAILEHGLKPAIRRTILDEVQALQQRLGTACELMICPCPAGSDERAGALPGWKSDQEHILSDVLRACEQGRSQGWDRTAVGIREYVPGRYFGTLLTLDRSLDIPAAMLLRLNSDDKTECYSLRRAHPFTPMRTENSAKNEFKPLPDGLNPLSTSEKGLYRGTALLSPKTQRKIAEAGIILERALGLPQKLHWVLDDQGLPHILDVQPLPEDRETDDSALLVETVSQALVLLQGGSSAQSGVAAGRIVHIGEQDDPAGFPLGAIAVARTASPRFASFLPRVGAIITELGSSIGHLATVAREYRIPAIFGATGALAALKPGQEVTVDSSLPAVYKGSLDILLQQSRAGAELFATDPEFSLLRRLLRFIIPLSLTDSHSPNFRPEKCGSYHDIIHFAHERAVKELLRTHQNKKKNGPEPVRLQFSHPVDFRLIDAGGGLAGVQKTAETKDILSQPMLCFLSGLAYAWDNRQRFELSLGEIFSGMQRSAAILQGASSDTGRNLAILADGYCNISLHMGYHYSVIDAFMQDQPNQNHIYFRFAGGFADSTRKNRRTELIRRILSGLQFHVKIKGDLVTGRLKIVDREIMADSLKRLGMLTAFTRQLDISMTSEDSLKLMEQKFQFLSRNFVEEMAE